MAKEKILIIDGDEYVRNTLYNSLKPEYEVFISESFTKAMQRFKEVPINVVVTEIDTADLKGVEVLRKFKEVKSDITLIVVTTFNSVPLAVEAMKAGAYDYITKPFNVDELKLVIGHAMERHKLIEEVKEKKIYEELAILDGLTRVYNRRYFEELLHREASRATRYPQKFSLLMIDIDNFKLCNDTYGHLAGDKVLKDVAGILLQKTRGTDFVARYGGEEFSVIAPQTDKIGASVLGARLAAAVCKENFNLDNAAVTKVTISVGIATFGEDVAAKKELIQCADKALYEAKRLGKNRVCLFGIHS